MARPTDEPSSPGVQYGQADDPTDEPSGRRSSLKISYDNDGQEGHEFDEAKGFLR